MNPELHSFANRKRKTLPLQARTMFSMAKKLKPRNHAGKAEFEQLVQKNVRALMDARSLNDGAVANLAKGRISKRSVGYLRNANSRHADDLPDLERGSWISSKGIAGFAWALGIEPWEVLHPDLKRAQAEREFYKTAVVLLFEKGLDPEAICKMLRSIISARPDADSPVEERPPEPLLPKPSGQQ